MMIVLQCSFTCSYIPYHENKCYLFHIFTGLRLPQPERLEVNVLDGEVTAFWQHPAKAPSNFQYNVQMAKYVQHHTSVFFHEMFTVHVFIYFITAR